MNEEGKDGMRRLLRRLVVIGLHRDRVKAAALDDGRHEKRWQERKLRIVDRLSRRVARDSAFGGDGIRESLCSMAP